MVRTQIRLKVQDGVLGKKCTKCEKWKSLEEFSVNAGRVGNRHSQCKLCKSKNKNLNKNVTAMQLKMIELLLQPPEKSLKVGEILNICNISKQTFYNWKKEVGFQKELAKRKKELKHKTIKEVAFELLLQKSVKEVAKELGVSRATVFNWMKKENISIRKKITPNLVSEIVELYKKGESIRFISEEIGIPKQKVSKILRENGYDTRKMLLFTLSNLGRDFEKITDQLMSELNVLYEKYEHDVLNPDYVLKNNIWVDSKLSEWSIKNCNTVQRYVPYCKLLTIVFLRGCKQKDEIVSSKVRVLSVYKLVKQLPKFKQEFYLEKLKEIEDKIKQAENGELNEIGNRSIIGSDYGNSHEINENNAEGGTAS